MILAGTSVAALIWVAPATAAPFEPAVPPVWDALAACESDRTWNEGDGGLGSFRGGLQWKMSTWLAVKPDGAPADPAEATAAQEVAAGENLLAEPWGSWHHWPTCARKLNLVGGGS